MKAFSNRKEYHFGIKISVLGLFVAIILSLGGCKKLIDVKAPVSNINADNVYTSDATAAAVLTGIYANLSKSNSSEFQLGGFSSLSLFAALSSDELTLFNINNQTYSGYYSNVLSSSPTVGTANYWNTIYPIIYITNSVIEGLNNTSALTPSVKQQLLGEAKFIRAFCYFYLNNLYGGVPLILSTNWQTNASLPRSSLDDVYLQIIDDLKDAENLLNSNYLKSDIIGVTTERVRPTKWAAMALLARVYLYKSDWNNAESEATAIISNNQYDTVPLNQVFIKNNKEIIWQLQAVGAGTSSNTGEGKLFILPAAGPNASNYPVYLSNSLVNTFEPGDKRKIEWVSSVTPSPGTITYYYPYKYRIGAVNTSAQEYCTVMRLAELYLIRAEARAQQNKISDAKSDLNVVRTRARLGNTTANDKSSLLSAIMQERRVEFFTEWGHRWLDLKRTNMVDSIMKNVTPIKNGTWQTTDQLYPIPNDDLQKASQLTQNPGY